MRSGESSRPFTICWVMVLPPCLISPPVRRFTQAARRIEEKSMPSCSKKELSSPATKAFTTWGGTDSSGVSRRRSLKNSPIVCPWRSTTRLASAGW